MATDNCNWLRQSVVLVYTCQSGKVDFYTGRLHTHTQRLVSSRDSCFANWRRHQLISEICDACRRLTTNVHTRIAYTDKKQVIVNTSHRRWSIITTNGKPLIVTMLFCDIKITTSKQEMMQHAMPLNLSNLKFSYTCYRVLGLELIPVYRQSAYR